MKFEFKEHTDKGLVREVNEDNLGHSLNSKNGDVFVVCDGMGGHVGGQTASTIGVNALLSELTSKTHNNMHVAISQALTFANEQVLGHAEADPSLKGMGSTATVCLFKDDLLYVGHVGDSRAYIYSDKKLYRITRDDSYVQELVDKGVITEDEAEMHPNKNRILQALGSTGSITPRIPKKPFKLKTGDLLLLCSDGLTSMVVDELIEQLINPQDLGGTLQELHKIAMTNGGKDNITMTLIKITESPYLQNDFDHFTVKYNTKKTTSTHKITGTPPPIDISAPAKKKVPMSYILGAAAVLLLIVAGYFFLNRSEGSETAKVDKIETVPYSQISDMKSANNAKEVDYSKWINFKVTGVNVDLPYSLGSGFEIRTDSILVKNGSENLTQEYKDDPDSDGDGVKDSADKCPNKRGSTRNGCPEDDSSNKSPKDQIEAAVGLVKVACTDKQNATEELAEEKEAALEKAKENCRGLIKQIKNNGKWQNGWKEEKDCKCNNN